jgi:putative colanic acid biosynthesis acetyltransferase WcaF
MDLSRFDNSHYHPGARFVTRTAWYLCNALIFDSWLMPVSAVKRAVLRLFGARIGCGVVLKPRVNIKYPWRLSIGDHSWIGEGVWIDNLAQVDIGANVCVSQGAYLLTGNHDYRDQAFGLTTAAIRIEDEAWVGAFCVVCPGVSVARGSVLSVRSVASADTEEFWVYRGTPAQKWKPRFKSTLPVMAQDRVPA